jgi:iron complex outermembrane receptor protein
MGCFRKIHNDLLLGVAIAAILAATPAQAQQAEAASGTETEEPGDIVVTATRRSETLSKVPISVSAFSQQELEARGVREFSDVVRLTPGLSLQKSPIGGNDVSIRGIASSAGASTTGIYIDETPIQARNLGYAPSTAFPSLFDIERIEVLRGPQGTLFGAGSEGGTVRFIQTEPSLTDYSYRARGEIALTRGGAESYEVGAAVGGPLILDKIGFRVSGYYRRNGGWIDDVDGTYTILDPSAASYGNSISFNKTSTIEKNANFDTALLLRGALLFELSDNLTVSPSITYQKLHTNDGVGLFWLAASDPAKAQYARYLYQTGNPATNPALTALSGTNREEGNDRFYLPALRVNWDIGFASLTSNTSYYDREQGQRADYTRYYYRYMTQQLIPQAGARANSDFVNKQKNFVQEVRLQSGDPDQPLQWLVGVFYSHNEQQARQPISQNFTANLPVISFGGIPFGVTDGEPFGPGSSAFVNTFGTPLLTGSVSYDEDRRVKESQLAGFAQVDLRLSATLKVTAGVRVSRNWFKQQVDLLGPESNINAPYGTPCVVYVGPGGTCTIGQGPLTPAYPSATSNKTETSVTPKFGLVYEPDSRNLFYATAAKGFRPGGSGPVIPPNVCDADLRTLGYSSAPTTYDSDSVWSYEVGSKNRILGGRASVAMSGYIIKWKNIQTNIGLPTCGYSFVDNAGDATAKGFDFSLDVRPLKGLGITGSVGYTKATFDDDVTRGAGFIFPAGSGVPGASAPWNTSVSGTYDFPPVGDLNFYTRLDFTHTSRGRRAGPTQPGAFGYNPLAQSTPAYSTLNARLGLTVDRFDLSVFVTNITDAHPYLALMPASQPIPNDPVWAATTIRPRTFGLTLSIK